MNKNIFKLLVCLLVSFGSSSIFAQQNLQQKSSSEIQAIQTRTYQNSYKEVFRVVVSVLQDNKYKVSFTDMNAGLITASGSPQLTENMNQAVAFIPFIGGLLSMAREEKSETWTVSGTLEEMPNKKDTLVRLVITSDKSKSNIIASASEKMTNEDLTDKPEIYQDLFAKIDKALLLRGATR